MNHKNPVCLKTAIRSAAFVVTVMAAFLGFAGCASLNKTLCLEGDWYEIGLRDGESGVESEQFDEYVDTCAKYDVIPDVAKYSEGRTKGLEFFCTRSVGYSEGRQGREYRNVCSESSEKLFLDGHSLGYNLYSTEKTIEDLDRTISENYDQIRIWQNRIDEIEETWLGQSLNPDLTSSPLDTAEERAARRQDILDAKTEIEELQELKAEAMIEYRRALDEASDNGFQEEEIIEYPEVDDEARGIDANP
ncbi:MAG: DUF2799 domain-containing protein [Gammaproteobacteria bacterium]|nr:DUF2799 domain-containing protein [Gammaproteobacteria bacterium]